MRLYRTSDAPASIRAAHEAFTHVLVNRAYTTIRPAFFRSSKIADLPVYQWAKWLAATDSQLERWRANGGVLIDRYTYSDLAGPADVLVFVECPLTMMRIQRSMKHIAEYGVIYRPHTWSVHEFAIDCRQPSDERLRVLWAACAGQRLTDAELAEATGLPRSEVTYQRSSFKPAKEWEIQRRLKPEEAHFLPAWEWVGERRMVLEREAGRAGHRNALREMARLGYIGLTKYQRYESTKPDWKRFAKKRKEAIADLHRVQSLVESLPDHPSESPPSDVSALFAARSRGKARSAR